MELLLKKELLRCVYTPSNYPMPPVNTRSHFPSNAVSGPQPDLATNPAQPTSLFCSVLTRFARSCGIVPNAIAQSANLKLGEIPAPDVCVPKFVRSTVDNRLQAQRASNAPSNKPSISIPKLLTMLLAAIAALKGAHCANSNQIVIGVMDEGLDINHKALINSIFLNDREIPENGQDDDLNGYIDDVHGYNFCDDTAKIFAGDHGTHVAGIIAGQSDGTTEIPANAKLLPLNICGDSQSYWKIIQYAEKLGARIINMSFGSPDFNQTIGGTLYETMKNSSMLFVVSAGNDHRNLSSLRHYPASFALPNMLVVAALNANGYLADFSNFDGPVEVGAPGVLINSTLPNNTYGLESGTSMAAPFVVNLLIQELVKNNSLTNDDLKLLMRNSPLLVSGDRLMSRPADEPSTVFSPSEINGLIGGAGGLCLLVVGGTLAKCWLANKRRQDAAAHAENDTGQVVIAPEAPPQAGNNSPAIAINVDDQSERQTS